MARQGIDEKIVPVAAVSGLAQGTQGRAPLNRTASMKQESTFVDAAQKRGTGKVAINKSKPPTPPLAEILIDVVEREMGPSTTSTV